VVRQIEQHEIRTRSPVHAGSTVTPMLRRSQDATSCVPTKTFGSRDVGNGFEAAHRASSQADGTARAVRVGDHDWSELLRSPETESPKEQPTDPSTVHRDENVASGKPWVGGDSSGGNRTVVGHRPTA